MARAKQPNCPYCNVVMVESGPYPVDVPLVGEVPATLYVCQNPDELCGYFAIIGTKVHVEAPAPSDDEKFAERTHMPPPRDQRDKSRPEKTPSRVP